MSWEKVKLGDISISIQPGPFGSQLHSSDYASFGTPIIMPKDMIDGKISHRSLEHVPEEHVNRLSRHKVIEGDLIMARKGDVRKGVYITKDEEGWLTGSDCLKVSLNRERCFSKFIFYQLKSEYMGKWLETLSIGATMPSLNSGLLGSIEVFLPSIETQMRIASILSAYDDLIENNQKQIKLLEEAAQRLYKEWFVDLRYPGHEDVPVVDGVPAGWRKVQLSEIADVIMGQSPKSEFYNDKHEGLPFHQGVGSYGNRFVNDEVYTTSFTRIAEAGSVLFSVRAPVGRLNITKNRIVIGRGLAAMKQKNGNQSFLFYMLKERFFKDNIVGNGSIFASISKEELLNQVFIVPIKGIMSCFNTIAQQIDERIRAIDTQNDLLVEARDRLLPKLMSGEIEV